MVSQAATVFRCCMDGGPSCKSPLAVSLDVGSKEASCVEYSHLLHFCKIAPRGLIGMGSRQSSGLDGKAVLVW